MSFFIFILFNSVYLPTCHLSCLGLKPFIAAGSRPFREYATTRFVWCPSEMHRLDLSQDLPDGGWCFHGQLEFYMGMSGYVLRKIFLIQLSCRWMIGQGILRCGTRVLRRDPLTSCFFHETPRYQRPTLEAKRMLELHRWHFWRAWIISNHVITCFTWKRGFLVFIVFLACCNSKGFLCDELNNRLVIDAWARGLIWKTSSYPWSFFMFLGVLLIDHLEREDLKKEIINLAIYLGPWNFLAFHSCF